MHDAADKKITYETLEDVIKISKKKKDMNLKIYMI